MRILVLALGLLLLSITGCSSESPQSASDQVKSSEADEVDMKGDLWGPIDLEDWVNTTCMRGRCATVDDVREGRAAFCMANLDEIPAWPVDLDLPQLALLKLEEGDERVVVVVIQAEESEIQQTVGVRFIEGGNAICLFEELELIDETHPKFLELKNGNAPIPGGE